jgi:pimeloyl-ACP methyl ester carboxylesterase
MQLNFKKYGSTGPNIIILHGLLGSLDNWQSVAKKLAKSHTVYSIDQRNHGRSPHRDDIDYELLSSDLIEFCIQNGIHKTILIGHSMGGKVAMLTALLHPDFVDMLISVDIAPVLYSGGHEDILSAMEKVPLQLAKSREEVDASLAQTIHSVVLRQFILKNLSRNPDGSFHWKCNLEALIRHYRALMDFPKVDRTFSGSTHFIRGAESDYIGPENWNACVHYFPAAELHMISHAGHWVHADNSEEFLNILLNIVAY